MKKLFLTTVLVLNCSLAFATNYCTDSNTAMGIKWEEQSSTYADCTSNANNGTITGTINRAATGKFSFGAGYTNVNNTIIDFGSGATIDNVFDGGGTWAAWIAFNSTGTAGSVCTGSHIFAKGNYDGPYLCINSTKEIVFSYKWAGGRASWKSSTAPITTDGVFHHIMVYYNSDATGNNPRVFFDCSELTMNLLTGAPFGTRNDDSGFSFWTGIDASSGAGEGDFTIDEMLYYNGDLTASCSALSTNGIDGSHAILPASIKLSNAKLNNFKVQ